MAKLAADGSTYPNVLAQMAGQRRRHKVTMKPGKPAFALAALLVPYAEALGGAASCHTCCIHCACVAGKSNGIEGVMLLAGAHSHGKPGWDSEGLKKAEKAGTIVHTPWYPRSAHLP